MMIRRIEFDALIVSLAREAGAELVSGAEVVAGRHDGDAVSVVTRDGRRFSASYLIACDGVHSATARKLGIAAAWPRSALAIDMMEESPNADLRPTDPDLLWVQYGCAAAGTNGSTGVWEGYGYVFPKRDHINVGIGYLLSPYREASVGPAYQAHRGFVERLTDEGVLEGHSRRDCFTPFLIPIGGPRRILSHGRVLLAGDAAGFVHGLTAEGIYYAMVSGDLAARTVVEAMRSRRNGRGPDLSAYTHAWRSEVGQELRDSVALQRFLFGSRDRVDAVIAGAARNASVATAAIRYLAGETPYRAVRSHVLSRNPGVVISLAADAVARVWRSLAT